jgi:hypothetical protein
VDSPLNKQNEVIVLDDGRTLHVVHKETSPFVLLSYVKEEQSSSVQERVTIRLDSHQAMRLAKALAGVSTLAGRSGTFDRADTEPGEDEQPDHGTSDRDD